MFVSPEAIALSKKMARDAQNLQTAWKQYMRAEHERNKSITDVIETIKTSLDKISEI